MTRLLFVTHGDVVIDADVAVTDWRLSERGLTRHAGFAARCPPVSVVACSTERKAREGADILARAQGLTPHILAGLCENDRSATGYLPKREFEAVADAFFARPTDSVRGWERAVDAQARVVAGVQALVHVADGDVAVVAHGGVGALLRAWVLGADIDRSHDQPPGQGGNVLVIDVSAEALGGPPEWSLARDWTDIDRFDPKGTGA